MPLITTCGIPIYINIFCGQQSECIVVRVAVYIHYKILNVYLTVWVS